jgi:mRNA interferase MazF
MIRGEIWWASLPDPWGRRPVLLLSRDGAYSLLTWVIVAPLTTTLWDAPTAVLLDPRYDGVPRRSVISLDNLQSIRLDRLNERITRLRLEKMQEVERAIHFALGLTT